MLKFTKRALKTIFPIPALHFKAYSNLIRNKHSYLYTTGWMNSLMKNEPVDASGNPVPWMNLPAVSLLKERLTPNLDLFEFGSGGSTLFFSRHVGSVTSVEYDSAWISKIRKLAPENVNIVFQANDEDGAYCRTVLSSGHKYDVVVVDGRDRVNCIKQGVEALSPKGVIILDDSQRERYQEGIEYAQARGFSALNIEGLKATGSGVDRTTFFYRPNNCLAL